MNTVSEIRVLPWRSRRYENLKKCQSFFLYSFIVLLLLSFLYFFLFCMSYRLPWGVGKSQCMWLIWRKLLKNNNESKWHSNTNPRSGQYLTHAHSHMTRPVAAMDSCFGLVRPHQHGIAVAGQQIGQKALCTLPFTAEAGAKYPFNLVCESRSYTWLFISTWHFITLLQIIKLLWHLPDTLGKYSETIVWHSDNFWRIFGKCSEIFRKSSKSRH